MKLQRLRRRANLNRDHSLKNPRTFHLSYLRVDECSWKKIDQVSSAATDHCTSIAVSSARKARTSTRSFRFALFKYKYTGSAAGMESLEKVWNLFFQFPDLEKVWKFVKSFGNFKKRFGTFCLLPEKNFEDRKCASRSEVAAARLTESSSRVVSSFHICSYSSYKLLRAGLELLARRFKQKRHARNSSFVKKRSFSSQAVDPDFRLTVFVNEESLPEPVICSLLLTLPASRSHFRENVIAFCPLEFSLSLWDCLKGTTRSRFPCFVFFFFLFSLKKASARFSKCASRDPGRGADGPAPTACSRSMRVRSRAKHFRWAFDLTGARRSASRLGAGVKTAWDLSKLKSGCRSVTALSITQRGSFTGVELSGPSQVLENVGLFRK